MHLLFKRMTLSHQPSSTPGAIIGLFERYPASGPCSPDSVHSEPTTNGVSRITTPIKTRVKKFIDEIKRDLSDQKNEFIPKESLLKIIRSADKAADQDEILEDLLFTEVISHTNYEDTYKIHWNSEVFEEQYN